MPAARTEVGREHGESTNRSVLPGVLAAVAVAIVAKGVGALLPDAVAVVFGDVILVVALGMGATHLLRIPARFKPGIDFCMTQVLKLGIVLLGANLAVGQLVAIGGTALTLIIFLMISALIASHFLALVTRTPSRVASLVGIGVSVCGNTAIIATAPAIGATDDEVATAITVNTLFGTIALFAYPLMAQTFSMDPLVFGTWAGTAVNDTSQVVAAGFAYGAVAGQLAVTIKLARNAMMGFVIVGMTLAYRRSEGPPTVALLRSSFPLFVVGFVLMALANSLGMFDAIGKVTGIAMSATMVTVARALLLIALAGVGLSASLKGFRSAGWRPFAVGLAAATLTSVMSLVLITAIGPAGV